jgi:Tfp pilus assembly protein PilV
MKNVLGYISVPRIDTPSRRMSQAGTSLIQVLIALGIMGIVSVGFATMMVNQQRQATQLTEKLASLDVVRVVTSSLSDGSVCTFMLTNGGPIVINPMAIAPIPAFASLPSRGAVGSTPVAVADGVTPASPMSTRLAVNSIQFKDLACATLPCTPTSNEFTANLQLDFNQAKLTISLAPLKFPVLIATVGPPGAQTIASCAGGRAPVRQVVKSTTVSCGGSQAFCAPVSAPAVATCPPGFRLTGCGYELVAPWAPTNNDGLGQWTSTFHANAPDDLKIVGETCTVVAGGAPGCGVCFSAQAICFKF